MATILIVDDRAINREFLMTLLSYGNHTLFEACDGAEALAICKDKHPDLIVTDILMPTMSGYELAQKLQADSELSKIPIIFYTATYRLDEANLLANSCGVKFVLTKPSDPEVIIKTVNKALGVEESTSPVAQKIPEASIKISETKELSQIGDRISDYLSDMEIAKQALNNLIKKTEELASERDRLIKISENFSHSLDQFSKISSRLVTLSEFNLDIISERDSVKLTKLFCDGSRKIIGTKYAVLGILEDDNNTFRHYLVSGNALPSQTDKSSIKTNAGIIGQALNNRDVLIIENVNELTDANILSTTPPIQRLMIVPLITKTHLYGFMYYADKEDDTAFKEVDSNMAITLATEFLAIYENMELYDLIQRHAAKLQVAMTERDEAQAKLTKSELMFRQFAENIREIFFRTTPNLDKIIYVSPAYEEIWGRPVKELYENSSAWAESILPEDQEKAKAFYTMAANNIQNLEVEFRIKRPDGDIRTISARANLLRENGNGVVGIVGIATDISIRAKYRDELKSSLAEKEVMLKEIYHRVKNNLQVVSSLLNLQANQIEDPETQKIFMSSSSRVKAMALVHELLYQSDNLAQIDMGKYAHSLLKHLSDIYHAESHRVKTIIDSDPISLSIEDAIPCGLVINELISNVFKHAFPPKMSGEMILSIKQSKGKVILKVHNNGANLPEDFDIQNSRTLGVQLINNLTKQLGGTIKSDSTNGTTFTLTFSPTLRGGGGGKW